MQFFIIFALIMLILCVIGAYNVVTDANRRLGECRRVVIVSCVESMEDTESSMQCYNVCIEMETEWGTEQKIISSRKYYMPGSEHMMYVNVEADLMEEVADIEKEKKNGMIGLVCITLLFMAITAVVLSYLFDSKIVFMVYASLFLLVGVIYAVVTLFGLTKNKAKKYNDLDFYKVPGRVVELARNYNGSRVPVYEFYDDGVRRTISSPMAYGRRTIIQRRMGDEVVIIINRHTKEAYCENDQARQKFIYVFAIGILIVVVGAVVWAVMQ